MVALSKGMRLSYAVVTETAGSVQVAGAGVPQHVQPPVCTSTKDHALNLCCEETVMVHCSRMKHQH